MHPTAAGAVERIFVARRFSILSIALNSTGRIVEELPLKDLSNVVAVDYDPVDDEIYWTDLGVRENR